MGILRVLFGESRSAPEFKNTARAEVRVSERPKVEGVNSRMRPGQGLAFDPKLVPSLMDDHRYLVEAFQRISAEAAMRNSIACRAAIKDFASLLTDHLIVENTRFYLYVRIAIEATDPDSARLARSFQQEMHQIALTVTNFVGKYTGSDSGVLEPEFLAELQTVGAALVARIGREETTLYPLYRPVD